jgi:parvulin-like peptidyl-prolyl isomerase
VRQRARVGIAVVALAVVAAGVSGCGRQTTSPGAAAIVGDQRISTQTLQDAVDASLQDPQAAQDPSIGGNRVNWTRTELARLIDQALVAAAAAAHGIAVTNNEIQQQLAQLAQQYGGQQKLEQQAAQHGVPASELPTFIRYFVLQQKLADALVAKVPVSSSQLQQAYQQNIAQFQSIHTAHILVSSKALAEKLLKQVKAKPSSFAALAAKYSQDTGSKSKGGDIGFAPRTQLDPGYANAAFAAAPGSYIVAHSSFGWHVIHVIAKKTQPLSQVAGQLKANLLKQQRSALLAQALANEAKKLGVHVNPRYGTWDASNQQVVPIASSSDVSKPSPGASSTG